MALPGNPQRILTTYQAWGSVIKSTQSQRENASKRAEQKKSEMCIHMLEVIGFCRQKKVYFWETGIDTVKLDCHTCNKSVEDADHAFYDDPEFFPAYVEEILVR